MKLKTKILGALGALLFASAAVAAGMETVGYPAASLPLTGIERIPADTGLASGQNPQSEAITTSVLKSYIFGNAASGTGTAAAGAVTLNAGRGIVTTESLSTAAGAVYTLTMTDSAITASSVVLANVGYGSATTGTPVVATVTPGAGSVVIKVQNIHASAALNGTLIVSFAVLN